LMVMEGDVLVKSMVGSMRRRSRGCSRCSRSRSRRLMRSRRTAPASSSLNTYKGMRQKTRGIRAQSEVRSMCVRVYCGVQG
jgi:hypothetical protein